MSEVLDAPENVATLNAMIAAVRCMKVSHPQNGLEEFLEMAVLAWELCHMPLPEEQA